MGRLLLFEDEQLVTEFRPHAMAYVGRFAGSFLWTVAGALGGLVAILVNERGSSAAAEWGLASILVLGLLFSFLRGRVRKGASMTFAWLISLVAVAAIAADVAVGIDWPGGSAAPALALGAGATVARLLWHELDRRAHQHFLTSERLVVRGGLTNRREQTRHLRDILEVRSERGVFGGAFDYGDLTLVFSRRIRGGKDPEVVEDRQILHGIAPLDDVKHQLEELMLEQRMPTRDRRRRSEERRLKASMRVLAQWMRREPAGPRS